MAAYYNIIYPKNPIVARYVKYIWAMIGDEPDGNISLLPPINDFDLVFSFQAGVDWKIDNRIYSLDETFTAGPRIKPAYINSKGVIHYLSVTFYPGMIYPFLGLPVSNLKHEPVELGLLPCPHLKNAPEMVWNAYELEEKAEIVEQIILKRLTEVKETDNLLLRRSIQLIQNSEGRMSVNSVCEKTGVSSRKLERDFSKWVGVSPKQFIKIERFNNVFTQIAKPEFDEDWFELVLRYGYHDQSHLIHDFKSMMDQTPEEYLFNLRNHPEIFAS
ncbi:MAG: helix-turn-helix transcriptional regulator [Prolixibacteraceae bacterium]|nr:helix-turn-helix transcriptional regulator [Prolixibacteraceae bacterium]